MSLKVIFNDDGSQRGFSDSEDGDIDVNGWVVVDVPEGFDSGTNRLKNVAGAATVMTAQEIADEEVATRLRSSKNKMRERINATRDESAAAPVSFNGKFYDATVASRGNLDGAIMNGQVFEKKYGPAPFSLDWIATDDTKIALTLSQLEDLGLTMAAQVGAMYRNANEHKVAVEALTTEDAVLAYDFSSGW